MKKLEEYVRSIPDFPEPGVIFRDVTSKPAGRRRAESCHRFHAVVSERYGSGRHRRAGIQRHLCLEFPLPIIFTRRSCLCARKESFPVRRSPRHTIWSMGSEEIEIHKDAIRPGQKVAVVDDLIATGGTVEAAVKLIERLGRRGCEDRFPYGT